MRKEIYICTTEDKKNRIYFNLDKKNFSRVSINSTPTKSILIFFSIIGFVLLRSLKHYKLPQEKYYLFFLAILASFIFGFIASFFLKKKKLLLSSIKIDDKDREKYIILGREQLKKQKAGLVFVFFLASANTCLFFLDNSIITMLVISIVYFCIIIAINYMDILRREKIYNLIEKGN